ncbi:N-acetyl-gamma-glutamylphosphate reductase [Paenibacillus harenae]|nr:N-acetyl-gamma-glutamylphosphate reductase [Paenibacillus harenae]
MHANFREHRTEMKVIISGTTGMVGEGVLHECLNHPDVSQVLVINRKPCGELILNSSK